eukprot:1869312-Amphidinium_carterae.1
MVGLFHMDLWFGGLRQDHHLRSAADAVPVFTLGPEIHTVDKTKLEKTARKRRTRHKRSKSWKSPKT